MQGYINDMITYLKELSKMRKRITISSLFPHCKQPILIFIVSENNPIYQNIYLSLIDI